MKLTPARTLAIMFVMGGAGLFFAFYANLPTPDIQVWNKSDHNFTIVFSKKLSCISTNNQKLFECTNSKAIPVKDPRDYRIFSSSGFKPPKWKPWVMSLGSSYGVGMMNVTSPMVRGNIWKCLGTCSEERRK
jgi:hypothetical protein